MNRQALRFALAIALCGCAEIPKPAAPKNVADLQKAIDNTCRAALAICNVYELLPPEAHNAADDESCVDARSFCAKPAEPAAP